MANVERLLDFALAFPGAVEEHPWGETVAKVNKKIFVFFGGGGMSVKLPDSAGQALMVEGAQPTGYGLGRSGWVSVPVRGRAVPIAVLRDWIEESYRTVAPRRLVAELDERAGGVRSH